MGISNSFKVILVLLLVTVIILAIPGFFILQLFQTNYCKEYDFIRIDRPSSEVNNTLFLTNYIKKNKLAEAREKALLVDNWKGVTSFSGYFTVNESTNSNLFFWFFPVSSSYNESKIAPVILYLQGGPGTSSLIGLFLETGPFYIDADQNLQKRTYAWTETNSVLYIDSPVSTGFSFANEPKDYPMDTDAVTKDLYEALTQFFMIFGEYQSNDFYIAGTSYAGKYIPILANLIHKKNQHDGKSQKVNLQGVIIGGGYFDAAIQDKFGEFNYYLGFIDKKQKDLCVEQETKLTQLIAEQKYEEARSETLVLKSNMTNQLSGFRNYLSGNGLEMETPNHFWNFNKFLETSCVKHALHTNKQYLPIGSISLKYSRQDYYRSTRPEVETLLNAQYKFLIFASQFDMVVPHFGISNFLNLLEWNKADEFGKAPRNIWRVNGTIAGYVKEVPRLTYVLIRNAGHMPCLDKSSWCFDMINRFTNNLLFS